jgi:multiple sugar transport system permease protein
MDISSRQAFVSRGFKYGMVWPAVLVILLIGLFPIIYTLIVSFQNFDMFAEDARFHGIVHYERLVGDRRFWQSILHTFVFLAIALPLELILGMLLALLFLDRLPGKQIFVALLILPVVTSPIIAGATWRLLFDNRYGPINQIIGWFTSEPATILWTVNPMFVYPAILLAEIWQWTPFMFLLLLAGLSSLAAS